MSCRNNARHWFAPVGLVGVVLPTCDRCGAPNPKWTPKVAAEMEAIGYGASWRAER
jgi:hypothetical protein